MRNGAMLRITDWGRTRYAGLGVFRNATRTHFAPCVLLGNQHTRFLPLGAPDFLAVLARYEC